MSCASVALTESVVLDDTAVETYKTFGAPADAKHLVYSFTLKAIQNAVGQKIYARVGDAYLHLTTALSLTDGASKDYKFEDLTVAASKSGSDLYFSVSIPSGYHGAGYIIAGAKSEGGSATVTDISFTLDCPEQCTYEEVCGSADFDFETSDAADTWNYGKLATGGGCLALDSTTEEVYKTFAAPADATNVGFGFELTEIAKYAVDQKIHIRVNDVYLHVTNALLLADGTSKDYTFGVYTLNASKSGSKITFYLNIPTTAYAEGYLILGVKSTGSSSTAVTCIDNVTVDMECPAEAPPTSATTEAPPITTEIPSSSTTDSPPTTTEFPASSTTDSPPTTTETPATTTSTKMGGGGGDPHFRRWDMQHTSFHGECDLVMVHSNQFHNGAGLDLHVRTTIEDYFSFIESAALRIGEHTIEVHPTKMYIDGHELDKDELPVTFGDDFKYTISKAEVESNKNARFYNYYKIDLHEDSNILFKFYKNYLTIDVSGHAKDFGDSVGLLGDYHTGAMVSRDGDIMDDFMSYGFEWQVNPEDAKLFMENRSPQLPFEPCRMPTKARPARRRLRAGNVALLQEATKACSKLSDSDAELCINDVMSTGDIGIATLW